MPTPKTLKSRKTRRSPKHGETKEIIRKLEDVIEYIKRYEDSDINLAPVMSAIPEINSITKSTSRVIPVPGIDNSYVKNKPKRSGPTKWNEFLKDYIAKETAKGRKITRLEAMAEAGTLYREKYGNKKTRRAPKTVVPQTLTNVSTPLEKESEATEFEETVEVPVEDEVPEDSSKENVTEAVEVSENLSTPLPVGSNYVNEGMNNTGMRKISIKGEKYFMTNSNRGLFKRNSDDSIGNWTGYLEKNGRIRETDAPLTEEA